MKRYHAARLNLYGRALGGEPSQPDRLEELRNDILDDERAPWRPVLGGMPTYWDYSVWYASGTFSLSTG